MLGSALTLLLAALVSGILGFAHLIGPASGAAQIIACILLAISLTSFLARGLRRPAY